jgi:bifunctional DNA-binding transcriptional regulator/antitoxin component of YhaV-PrlF toxin-antitoxin module
VTLRLEPGQFLELESSGDKIILRRARRKARIYKKGGIWVLRTGVPLATRVVEDTTRRVREEREQLALVNRRRNNVANVVRTP